MVGTEVTCRLCMSTDTITDLFKQDGDTTLDKKVRFCVDVKVNTEDGLPVGICKICEKNIKHFYEFKQKCLHVDSKLKAMMKCSYFPNKLAINDTDFDDIKMDVKIESDLSSKINSELKTTFDSWLSDDADSAFYAHYFNSQDSVNIEESKVLSEPTDDLIVSSDKKAQSKKQSRRCTNRSINSYKRYQCEICGHIMKNKSVLAKHVATHSGLKPFSCKLCSKSFTRAEHKVIHMRTHLGIKPYICEVCGRSFTKRQDLVRHMRIHSDEKKYSCPRCDRRFKRSGDVHSHLRTHTGAKPYTCTNCNKSYTSHSGLKKHYKTHCKKEIIGT